MGLKYVLNGMKRRKLRTAVVALALIIGVALVGALLNLVDTQRQFSLQVIGSQTGGYDLSIRRSDLAPSPFFDTVLAGEIARNANDQTAAVHPRIQGDAEATLPGAIAGTSISIVALDPDQDNLSQIRATTGVYPPARGQVFLTQPAADSLGVKVGDEIRLSYVRPQQREAGKAAAEGGSTVRAEGLFTVAGIGVAQGLGNNISFDVGGGSVDPLAVMRLDDAQAWLNAPGQAERLLVVWNSDTSAGSDAQLIVTRARNVGERVRDAVQAQLGDDYTVELRKYQLLNFTAQGVVFAQLFITLYGLLSMGIIGLMVNALMTTTVNEQKYDLAILRVLGSPRWRLFEAVVLEVIILGVIGLIFGLLLGRLISDYVITPLLLASLNLPLGVRPAWTLDAVITPTLITIAVLAIATISPARTAARTKVMLVLNPAAADQPTLEELAKLRERKTNYGLLAAGLILLAFCTVILVIVPISFFTGDQTAFATTYFASYLLMVIGMALVFYFITTPLERVLVWLFNLVSKRSSFFAGRYALRGKGRNALISLMIVASAVLPTLLATQLVLQDVNVETDTRFNNGAAAVARPASAGGFRIFNRGPRVQQVIDAETMGQLAAQPGVASVVGTAGGFNTQSSDRVQLRSASINLIGVQGDLGTVLFNDLTQWAQGDNAALARISEDRNAAIISLGLSEYLDLHAGDTIRIRGAGFDHEQLLQIVGVGARLPGFGNEITRNRNSAQGGDTGILVNLETYRALRHNPADGDLDPNEPLMTQALMRFDPAMNEAEVISALRDGIGEAQNISFELTTESISTSREIYNQQRIFTLLLTGVSMVTAVFGVLAVMYTAVLGRRVEIGMLKAIGSPARTLRGIFIGEAIITTLAAAIAGIIAGTLLGYAFEMSQRFAQEQTMLLGFDFTTATVIVVMVCLAAVFSAALATQPVIRQKAIKILREK
jgi:ABC-type antimicrobial peptide transport system permease subunit